MNPDNQEVLNYLTSKYVEFNSGVHMNESRRYISQEFNKTWLQKLAKHLQAQLRTTLENETWVEVDLPYGFKDSLSRILGMAGVRTPQFERAYQNIVGSF